MIFEWKKKVWYDDPPEDRLISIFAGCLANHDRAHSLMYRLGMYDVPPSVWGVLTSSNFSCLSFITPTLSHFLSLDLVFSVITNPSLNGHLHYPDDIDRSLNETATDKIRKYRGDYNNNPPNTISFMPDITSTSGRIHSEFVYLLFWQAHRETDRFFESSGVQLA